MKIKTENFQKGQIVGISDLIKVLSFLGEIGKYMRTYGQSHNVIYGSLYEIDSKIPIGEIQPVLDKLTWEYSIPQVVKETEKVIHKDVARGVLRTYIE